MKRLISLMCAIALFAIMATATERTHIVKKGETAESIAKTFGISTESLLEANPDLKQYIYAGMTLKIPAASTQTKPGNANESTQTTSATTKPTTIVEAAQMQESEKTTTNSNERFGVTYVADLDAFEYGMWGIMMDDITPMGWGGSIRLVTDLGIDGTKFEDASLLIKAGPSYCPSYTDSYSFFIPIMFNFTGYNEYTLNEKDEYESEPKFGFGLSLEPTVAVNLGGAHLSAGLDINWQNYTKKINIEIALGLTFNLQ